MTETEPRFKIRKASLVITAEVPFSHTSTNGINFYTPRCDLRAGITVRIQQGIEISNEEMSKAVAEMIGYHALNIVPKLNGFPGYGDLSFTSEYV